MQRPQASRVKKASKSKPQIPHIISRPPPARPVLAKHNYEIHNSGNIPTLSASHSGGRHVVIKQFDSEPANSPLRTDSAREFEKWDQTLDAFIAACDETTLDLAVERTLKEFYGAKEVAFWQEVPKLDMLYTRSFHLTTAHSSGLAGFCFFSRAPAKVSNPTSHPSFNSPVDGRIVGQNSSVYLFPVCDRANEVVGIVEIVKADEFSDEDIKFAEWFAKKVRSMSRWLAMPGDLDSLTLDIMALLREEQYRSSVFGKVAAFFESRTFEVWKYEKERRVVAKYDATAKTEVAFEECGVVGEALEKDEIVNVMNCRLCGGYNAVSDGQNEESVLAVPVLEDDHVLAVVLRGSKHLVFSREDYARLKKAAPHVLLSLANCEAVSVMENDSTSTMIERESLQALLEVVEILSSQLDSEKLPATIMEKGRTLTSADRCSLFLVNDAKDRLITYLHTGLKKSIDLPIDKGIAGQTVMKQKVFNIPDAYQSDAFDPSTDKESGYRTTSILCVPIFNNRGEIIGCTEMMNKSDGKPFSDWDAKVIQIFNVFCGISLENARLFKESKEMAKKLHGMFDTAFSLSKSEDIHKMLSDIMQNAKKSIGADRASFFVHDAVKNELTSLIVDGDKLPGFLPLDKGLAAKAVKTKQSVIENDCYANPDFNRDVDADSGYRTKSLMAVPIVSSKDEVMGVVELLNKSDGDFDAKDLDVLSALTTFASVALENSRLKDIAHLGSVEIEMMKWIAPTERTRPCVPVALELTEQEKDTLLSMNVFSGDFKGIGHFKECYFFFQLFNFFELFTITSEQFFRFLTAVSERYTNTWYHNWTHACDVTQCVVFQMKIGKIDEKYTAWEMFTLTIAAICHDTNHHGYNNVFNVKAETPLGILFKDQSVMEMHHITEAIPIISRDDIQLLHAFDQNEVKKVWTLFIRLILATDMAHHFELVKQAQTALDGDGFNFEDPDLRLLGLQLILKVADISNVSRPFEIANKWCDILNEEFFHQGDLEKESGIGLTSPLNDRDNANKPKSQIGFYNFICLPLYVVVARLYPWLQVNVEQLKSNLEQWKKLMEPPKPAE